MGIYARCGALHACRGCRPLLTSRARRVASYSSHRSDWQSPDTPTKSAKDEGKKGNSTKPDELEELGPMARRLQEATEEALFTGGRAGQQAVKAAGFSEELKEKLLSNIADAKFKNEFAGALAEADLSSKRGGHTGGSFGAHEPWAGEERTEDAVLRMLGDAKKPLRPELRGGYRAGSIDTRLKRAPVVSPGRKVAAARDRAAMYTGMGMKETNGLSDKEKEELKQEFRDRFRPEGRTGPISISAIESMANERIANAMARGQFKNIRRGAGVQTESLSNNPYVDTTEYLMNRLIQRQDIVPPWIEKQQELVRDANTFRARLRSDWKRHAARMISSKGGSLFEQIRRAELYAAAEQVHNPRQNGEDRIAVSSTVTDDPVTAKQLEQVKELEELATKALEREIDAAGRSSIPETGLPRPFRDHDWEKAEEKYMVLAIERLNGLTRSYNLMAPDLAKKPYFSLARELAVCYATVAPLLAKEIKDRATRAPPSRLVGRRESVNGEVVRDQIVGNEDAKIHVEGKEKAFGLKEWWRDVWKR